jgi:hypothetical protein
MATRESIASVVGDLPVAASGVVARSRLKAGGLRTVTAGDPFEVGCPCSALRRGMRDAQVKNAKTKPPMTAMTAPKPIHSKGLYVAEPE